MDLEEAVKFLENTTKNTKFRDLLKICETFFGKARIRGSHFIFKTSGKIIVNIQRNKKMAKAYQVKQVINALNKLTKERER